MSEREYSMFHCDKDEDWIVCVRKSKDLWIGVADCPDERTARAVLSAMRAASDKPPAPRKSATVPVYCDVPCRAWHMPPVCEVKP